MSIHTTQHLLSSALEGLILDAAVASDSDKSLDPRIRRTRHSLHEAYVGLLKEKRFTEISVQDVTDAASVNRATFYAHYPDKFVLLEATTATLFADLLEKRAVTFDGTCNSALGKIFLGMTDFLVSVLGDQEHATRLDPHMELSILGVVRGMVMDGLNQYPADWGVSQQTLANTVSWGLYGAAREWVFSTPRSPAEQIVDGVTGLLAPLVHRT